MAAGLISAGMLLCGVAAHAQPVISGVYPNGTNMFQPSSTLSFTATSGTGVTNITVSLTAKDLYTGNVLLSQFTSASGLTIIGPNVSAPLKANKIYTAVTIVAYDAAGSTTVTESFDTITPSYTWEAEDFDYTNGQYFDASAGVNQYAGLNGTLGVDFNNSSPSNGTAAYRPRGLETENPNGGDLPLRLQYIGTTNFDFDVGWTSGGQWGNYTRHYPAGTYTVFVRDAGGGNASTEAGDINIVSGTATTTNVAPYKFPVLGLGWGKYDFVPVTDAGGNLVQITFDGSVCTLEQTQVNSSDNMNFFMLMPVPVEVPSTVTITNVYPDGAFQFENTNSFTFNAISTVPINPATDISVQVAATNLNGVGSLTLLTTANGLSYTGNSTNITVTGLLTSNMVYSVLIIVNAATGNPASSSVNFDTIVPFYTFEAIDWNYNSGLFIDNPQTNGYGKPNPELDGVEDVDFHRPPIGTLGAYNRVGLATENCSDIPRVSHIGYPEFDNGNTTSGDWADYTRTFPAGIYNIYARVSRGNSGLVTDAGKISLVTGDPTQPNQAIQDLGKHNTPSTGGWQTYTWVPIINSGGYPARLVATGSPMTLRYTFDGAGDNTHFFLLQPADLGVNPPPYVTGFTPDGTVMFQPSNTVTFVANSSVGLAQSNVVLNLNGVNVSGLTFSGSSTMWNVSVPVKVNGLYTAIITLKDTAGVTSTTNVFSTLSASDYQWEAEDYDYTNGQYFDNPQVGSYAGLGATTMVDVFESDLNGPNRGNSYRPANGVDFPDATANDLPRDQFTAAGKIDYNLGSFGTNSWANYTRHYPAGTYNVIGRFGEGAGIAGANLSLLTNGVSTNLLGSFTIQNLGWGNWQWQEMLDGSGNPAIVTLDGNAQILRLGGTTANEVNVNFLLLVPATPTPKLTGTSSGETIYITMPTQTGYAYQLQYKNHISDAGWISLGAALSGNNSVQSVTDSAIVSGQRYYRVQVQ